MQIQGNILHIYKHSQQVVELFSCFILHLNLSPQGFATSILLEPKQSLKYDHL
jgi:hypothetical protein